MSVFASPQVLAVTLWLVDFSAFYIRRFVIFSIAIVAYLSIVVKCRSLILMLWFLRLRLIFLSVLIHEAA